MSAVTGMIGLGGGAGGTSFNPQSGTNQDQINNSYNQNQNLLSALQQQNGLGNQSQVYNQFQGVANGTGPNPAQAMLNQSTGQNVANQAALMAGQRGASANVGLMARQAAQTGANAQQQAAGQGATMQANQSLNALGQAGTLATNMAGNQISATQNEQNTLQNANNAFNTNQTTLAGNQQKEQANALGGLGTAVGAAAHLLPLAAAAAEGGVAESLPPMPSNGPQSSLGKYLFQPQKPMMAKGGKVPAMVSPGELYLKPQAAKAVAQGNASPMKAGEKIPGKPKVPGNSYANDVVPKKLDVGGVVIPNSVMQSKNPERGAAEFVRAHLAKNREKSVKIDFKDFKKIETTDKTTILQHPEGHHIVVAHKSLSPEYRKELEKLPVCKAAGGKITYKEFQKNFDASSGPKGSKVAKSSNTMPGSPTEAKNSFTEPDDMGTGYAPGQDVVLKAMHREMPPMGPMGAEKPHYAPCINPACKSYGHSHPNCRCYGGNPEGKAHGEQAGMFAEGGEVEEKYCDAHRVHKKNCEYFKLGGIAGGDVPGEAPQEVQTADAISADDHSPQATPEVGQPDINPNPESTNGNAPAAVDALPPADPNAIPATPDAPAPAQSQAPQDPLQKAKDTGAAVQNHLTSDDAATKSDINAGHIKPETYKSLYGKEDTLGKLGTLFGLIVGGFGSGLTGKENPVLGMMDKQIQNDLQAQQQSAGNRQTLLKINQENLANNANVNLTNEQKKSVALANTYMQMNRLGLDSLVQANNKLPPGSPQRAQGDQMLAILSQGVDKKNASIASQAGLASAVSHAVSGGGQNTMLMKSGMMGPEFKEMGEDIEQKTVPGVGRATIPVPQGARDEMTAMKVLHDKANDLLAYSKQHAGTLSPSQRKVAAQKAEEMVNFYNSSIKGGVLTQGRLKWLDDQISKNPTGVVTQLMGNNARLQEIAGSNDHRLEILKGQYGMKNNANQPQASAFSGNSGSSSGAKVINGVNYKKVNGGWQKAN